MSELIEHAENTDRAGRSAADLDAGAATSAPAAGNGDTALLEEMEEALKDVVDPELGVNIVDLGLVYDLSVERTASGTNATIDMTLTSAACPLTDMIEDQVSAALTGGPDGGLVDEFAINWVWLPPWDVSRITDDGREQMRALGFNI
jgi:metal-sulfur cluster biosynthetic enzyme